MDILLLIVYHERMTTEPLVLNAAEVARVVQALEGGTVTRRQVLHLTRLGVVTPSVHVGRARGETTLFDNADVALLRLAFRLRHAGEPWWAIKGLLRFQQPWLRARLVPNSRAWLRVDGATMALCDEAPRRGQLRIRLRDVVAGVRAAAATVRREQPDVWVGWRMVPAQAVRV